MSTLHECADACGGCDVRPYRGQVRSGSRPLTGVLVAVLLGSGCQIGPRPHRLPMQVQAAGATVEVEVRNADGENAQSITGELLSLEPDAVLLLADSIRSIDYDVIASITPIDHPFASRGGWEGRRVKDAEELRRLSRYPAGMPNGVLPRLLAAFGQEELVRIAPATGGRP